MDRSQVRRGTGRLSSSRSRAALVGALLAALALLGGLWWWLARDAEQPRRGAEFAPSAEVAVRGATELAASTLPSAVRSEPPVGASAQLAARESAVQPDTSKPHLLVTRGGAPLGGAHVELWNETRSGDTETLFFTSDAGGHVLLPPDLVERGPWFALASADGVCSQGLDPVLVDVVSGPTEIACVDAKHVAVVFERSDGLPTGSRPGVQCSVEVRSDGAVRWLRRGSVSQAQRRCLVAAGVDKDTADREADLVVIAWGDDPADVKGDVSGTFAEPDTERVAWSALPVPVAQGGALESVPLPVRDTPTGVVEVRFTGVEPHSVLANVGDASIRLRPRGANALTETLRLWVREHDTPLSSARTQFRVEAGRYSASADLGVLTDETVFLPVDDIVVEAGATTSVEFELPPLGILVPDEASLARLERKGRSVGVGTIDALTRSTENYDSVFGPERGAVLLPSRGLVRVMWPEPGFLVPSGTEARLLADPAAHAELLRLLEDVRRDSESLPLPTSLSPWFVDVTAGCRARVTFVPDPKREEK